mgnify:CR=1 FL=1
MSELENAIKLLEDGGKNCLFNRYRLPEKLGVKEANAILIVSTEGDREVLHHFRRIISELRERKKECEESHNDVYIFDEGINWTQDIEYAREHVQMACYYCGDKYSQKRDARQIELVNKFLSKPPLEERFAGVKPGRSMFDEKTLDIRFTR